MIQDYGFVFNYEPVSVALDRLNITLRELLIAAMEDEISLHVVNQSLKILTYAPITHHESKFRFIKHLLGVDYKSISYQKGEMVKLKYLPQIDLLAKGILTESEALQFHEEAGYYLVGSLNPFLRRLTSNYYLNNFHPITLNHVFVSNTSLFRFYAHRSGKTVREFVDELMQKHHGGENDVQSDDQVLTKQEKRELIFYKWLETQSEQEVMEMKKDDVVSELRKIDPHLFMGDQKHFFRLQKRITFKSGRKAENDD